MVRLKKLVGELPRSSNRELARLLLMILFLLQHTNRCRPTHLSSSGHTSDHYRNYESLLASCPEQYFDLATHVRKTDRLTKGRSDLVGTFRTPQNSAFPTFLRSEGVPVLPYDPETVAPSKLRVRLSPGKSIYSPSTCVPMNWLRPCPRRMVPTAPGFRALQC